MSSSRPRPGALRPEVSSLASAPSGATSRRPTEAVLVMVLGMLAAFGPLAIDMYLPAFSAIGDDLATDAVGWTLAVYFAGLSIGQVVIGPITDRIGRATPLRVGLALFALASLAAAVAPRIELLIAARLVQAIGGAACAVTTRAVVRDLYRGNDVARINSRLVLVMGVAPIVAPLAGGALLHVASWRAIFVVLAVLGVLGLVAVRALLPETAPPRATGPQPGLLRSLLGDRQFVVYAAVAALSSAGLFAYITGAPVVLIELHHVAPGEFGWYFGANAAGYILACQVNARLVRRFSLRALLAVGLVGFAVTSLILVGNALGLDSLAAAEVSYFLFLASLGLVMPNAVALALEHQGARAGSASAWIGAGQYGLAAGASSVVSALHDGSAVPQAGVMLALALLTAALVAAAARRR